jgi:O-antigen/teichoic acid export membrane protein
MSNSKLIAKNTLFLYLRMFFTLGATLITSRVLLNILGVEDFGIYSLLGGIVLLFSFLNSAMSSATQRFLAFDIGKNEIAQLKKTFNATLNIHFIIAFIFLLLAETIGLWFINNKLNISTIDLSTVNLVYQFSVFTTIVGIIQVPYDAIIVAKEKMNIYAYMGIIEVFFKLTIVYLLYCHKGNKLTFYAFLLFLVAFISSLIRKLYCKYFFKETKYEFYYQKELYQKLLYFSGWSLFGNIAGVAREQGSNILLNIFFGTILNATYGITMQVQSAVQIFVYNFQIAVNPQIFKQYALGNFEKSISLIFQSSKFSFYLMLLISCPIIVNIDYILKTWLVNPPIYTSDFIKLSLISVLIDSISGPLVTGALATGKIKWYQISIGLLIFITLPVSYLILKHYNSPLIVFFVVIIINILALIFRVIFLKFIMGIEIINFFREVIIKIFFITLIIFVISKVLILNLESPFHTFFIKSCIITVVNLFSIYFVGLNLNEKNFILMILKKNSINDK